MKARRHSISCDQISEVVQTAASASLTDKAPFPEANCGLQLKIIFSEDQGYVFGKAGEASVPTITIVTRGVTGCDRSTWRDAFKKKRSYEITECSD